MRHTLFKPIFFLFILSLLTSNIVLAREAKGKILDMTYAFGDDSIYWPTGKSFKSEKMSRGINDKGWWYASNDYSANEHGGTHADAPIHFAQNGKTMDQIPLEEWIGPAVKIDVTKQCAQNRDYLLTVDDIKNFEKKYGKIPAGAWVIMYTGIDTQFYPDKKMVLGTDKTGNEAVEFLSFPGFSSESVQYLLKERDIKGIALDTPSIDYGKSKDFPVHRVLCGAGKLAVENIANLDKLPPVGAILYAIPMMIKGGTGAPVRVFAVIEN